jgi:hypothetical protein
MVDSMMRRCGNWWTVFEMMAIRALMIEHPWDSNCVERPTRIYITCSPTSM